MVDILVLSCGVGDYCSSRRFFCAALVANDVGAFDFSAVVAGEVRWAHAVFLLFVLPTSFFYSALSSREKVRVLL